MGSKHSPPRWYAETFEEACRRWSDEQRALLEGRRNFPTAVVYVVEKETWWRRFFGD